MGGGVVYKLMTQSLIAGSLTEVKYIATHTAAEIAKYLLMILKQLGYKQNISTSIHIDNKSSLHNFK